MFYDRIVSIQVILNVDYMQLCKMRFTFECLPYTIPHSAKSVLIAKIPNIDPSQSKS